MQLTKILLSIRVVIVATVRSHLWYWGGRSRSRTLHVIVRDRVIFGALHSARVGPEAALTVAIEFAFDQLAVIVQLVYVFLFE